MTLIKPSDDLSMEKNDSPSFIERLLLKTGLELTVLFWKRCETANLMRNRLKRQISIVRDDASVICQYHESLKKSAARLRVLSDRFLRILEFTSYSEKTRVAVQLGLGHNADILPVMGSRHEELIKEKISGIGS